MEYYYESFVYLFLYSMSREEKLFVILLSLLGSSFAGVILKQFSNTFYWRRLFDTSRFVLVTTMPSLNYTTSTKFYYLLASH